MNRRPPLDPRAWSRADQLFAIAVLAVLIAPTVALSQAWSAGWTPYGDDAVVALRTAAILDGDWQITGMRSTSGATDPLLSTHHLGPLEFYLLAPFMAVTAGRPTGLALGCTALASGLNVWSLVWARRVGANFAILIFGSAVVLSQWALGPQLLYRPLNPFFGTHAVGLALITATALLRGQARAYLGFVVACSVLAQANLAFVPLVVALSLVVLVGRTGALLGRIPHRRAISWGVPGRSTLLATLVGIVLWLPSLCELFVRNPNNLEILWSWVTTRPPASSDPLVGIRQLALLAPVPGGFRGYSSDLVIRDGGRLWVLGAAILLALAIVIATRSRAHGRTSAVIPAWVALVANLGMVATALAMPEYPAAPYWLMHWIPVTTFTWAALVWGLAARRKNLSPDLAGYPLVRIGCGLMLGSLVLGTVLARPPLEDGSVHTRVAAAVADRLGEGDGRSVRIHGLGFLPLLGAAPAIGYGLHQEGWKPHFLQPWPYPEETEGMWLDSDPRPDTLLIILDTAQPEFADGLPEDAEKLAVVRVDDTDRYLAVYRVPRK